MKTKLFTLFVALVATSALWASNVITYTATKKLHETTGNSLGLHTKAFNVAIASHKFSHGTGTIVFIGEVTTIGYEAFKGCTSLTSITIPNSVTTIEGSAFYDCTYLSSITIPNSVATIGDFAFIRCSNLVSITIPNSVTTIGSHAFDGCTKLTSVTIGNSVTTIGDGAFSGCYGLISITCYADIPPTCSSGAFDETNQYVKVYVPASALFDYQIATEWGALPLLTAVSLGQVQGASHNDENLTETSTTKETDEDDVVFVVVEKMPEFPGGYEAMTEFLVENVKYPAIAKEDGIQGRVICQFVVNKDGTITDIEVIRSGGDPSLDQEAIRVIEAMPKWEPGVQRGKNVRVKYTVPVNFRLQ